MQAARHPLLVGIYHIFQWRETKASGVNNSVIYNDSIRPHATFLHLIQEISKQKQEMYSVSA